MKARYNSWLVGVCILALAVPTGCGADGDGGAIQQPSETEVDAIATSTEAPTTNPPTTAPPAPQSLYSTSELSLSTPDGWQYRVSLSAEGVTSEAVRFSKVIENSPPGKAQLQASFDGSLAGAYLNIEGDTPGRSAPAPLNKLNAFIPTSRQMEDSGIVSRLIGPPSEVPCIFRLDALRETSKGSALDDEVGDDAVLPALPVTSYTGVVCDIDNFSSGGDPSANWAELDETIVDSLVSDLNGAGAPIFVAWLGNNDYRDNSCAVFFLPDGTVGLGKSVSSPPECVISQT